MASLISKLFIRDRFTWLAYFMLAYYSYNFTLLGPLMPFLRSELDLSYTVTGLHLSTFALGMAMAGFSADYFSKRWVRWVIFFGGRRWDGLGCAGSGCCRNRGCAGKCCCSACSMPENLKRLRNCSAA